MSAVFAVSIRFSREQKLISRYQVVQSFYQTGESYQNEKSSNNKILIPWSQGCIKQCHETWLVRWRITMDNKVTVFSPWKRSLHKWQQKSQWRHFSLMFSFWRQNNWHSVTCHWDQGSEICTYRKFIYGAKQVFASQVNSVCSCGLVSLNCVKSHPGCFDNLLVFLSADRCILANVKGNL